MIEGSPEGEQSHRRSQYECNTFDLCPIARLYTRPLFDCKLWVPPETRLAFKEKKIINIFIKIIIF